MNHVRFSWVVALVATLGSLFFSEIMHYIPCKLCWYNRILMYPLVIFLGVAIARNDKKIAAYVLPMSILGIILSTYHYAIQKFSFVPVLSQCTGGVSCTTEYASWFGFITIPFLALVAHTIITITLILLIKKTKNEQK